MLVYLVIGLLAAPQYGETWDEHPRIDYAEHSLAAYTTGVTSGLQDEKGPFYGMLAFLGSQGLDLVLPGWKFIDGWHFMTFVSFVIGIYFFYRLCRRYMEPAPALLCVLLFSTQPLLWGHAFINPKDIPFMVFFLGSVTLGLDMASNSQRRIAENSGVAAMQNYPASLPLRLAGEWRAASRRARSAWLGLGLVIGMIVLSFQAVRAGLDWLVRQTISSPASSPFGELFARFSQNSAHVPVSAYVQKAQTLYSWLALTLGFLALLGFVWIGGKVFPSIFDQTLTAGCFLGFASAIRTLGPATGILVAVYFLVKGGWKAVPTLIKYLAAGALTTFFFWPYLWSSPFNHYLTSLNAAANYNWERNVLFAGQLYTEDQLPASYLPTLFGLQFTETAVAAILVGFVLAIIYFWKKPALRLDLLLLGAWCVVPVVVATLHGSTVYDNFRQFLFVTPPLFILAGLAFQVLWSRLNRKGWFVFIGALALLPGLYWDIELHPYQYVYYNSLAGQTSGAYRHYELDYWCSSYKEAIGYLNQAAPLNAIIYVRGPNRVAGTYARPDLVIVPDYLPPDPLKMPQFAVITTRENLDQTTYPASKSVYQVERAGATLTVVKQVQPGETAEP